MYCSSDVTSKGFHLLQGTSLCISEDYRVKLCVFTSIFSFEYLHRDWYIHARTLPTVDLSLLPFNRPSVDMYYSVDVMPREIALASSKVHLKESKKFRIFAIVHFHFNLFI